MVKPEIEELDLNEAWSVISLLRQRMRHSVVGRDEVIELILIALLADGHVLLEDYPGSGKTTLAKALGDSIIDDLPDDQIPSFSRIQFTPDLLPSDITGTNIFDPDRQTVTFRRGPLFAYVVLGDEINRTSPRVQAATLEAMAEKQITVDGVSHQLDDFFFLIATQNPLDLAGTYPLPTAQLDRFLFRVSMNNITRKDEIRVLSTELDRAHPPKLDKIKRGKIVSCRQCATQNIFVHPDINECLVDIARNIRGHREVIQGASTRSLMLARPALRAMALLRERDFVTADEVRRILPHLFCHRLILDTGARPADELVEESARRPLEKLAQKSLKR